MPLGPNVLLTRSPTAMAPTKAERRAFSPFSSVVPSSNIWVGLNDDWSGPSVVSQSGIIRVMSSSWLWTDHVFKVFVKLLRRPQKSKSLVFVVLLLDLGKRGCLPPGGAPTA